MSAPSDRSSFDNLPGIATLAVGRLPVLLYAAEPDDLWVYRQVVGGLAAQLEIETAAMLADPGVWLRLIHPEDRGRVVLSRREAKRTGHLVAEYRLRCGPGEERWLLDEAVLDANEDPPMMRGMIRDVTERRIVDGILENVHERALTEIDELRRVADVRGTIVELFAHDLRSPLAGACGLISTLRRRAGEITPERRDDLLRTMSDELDRARRMVEHVLVAWEGAAASGGLHARPVVLADMLADVLAELPEAGVAVRLDVEGVVVRADPVMLHRVLLGLVRNSRGYSPEGSTVIVAADERDDGVVISVEDDGPGVPDEQRAAIFEPFVRLASADGQQSGLGLGLALARRFARLHGGDIWVEDLPMGGAAFKMFLPWGGPGTHSMALVAPTDEPSAPSEAGPDRHRPLVRRPAG